MTTPSRLFSLLLLMVFATVSTPSVLFATDVETLSKEINKDVRQAERYMFSGKNEESDALLKQVLPKLEELRSADPEFRTLKSLQSKYDRLRSQVDRKLGKETSVSATKKTPEPNANPAETSSVKSSSSSVSTSRYEQQMQDRALKKIGKDVDYELGRAIESLKPEAYGVTPSSATDKTEEAMQYVERARDQLTKFLTKYPELDKNEILVSASKRIDEKVAEIETWKADQLEMEAAEKSDAEAKASQVAASQEQMEKDAALIQSLYDQYYPSFSSIYGGSLVQGMQIPMIENALKQLEAAERNIPEFSEKLGRLADTYGRTAMEIYNTMHQNGYTPAHGEEVKMEQLMQAIERVKQARIASAETVVDYAGALLGAFSGQLTDHRLKLMGDAKKLLLVGQQFDPSNSSIQEMHGTIDSQMADVADKMEELIDGTEWKDHIGDFSGPGKVKALASAAKQYFENDRDWGKKPEKDVEILKVSIQGPWKVAETDPFGRVIQWRLPIHVAATDNNLKTRGLVRVYDLSILAQEGAPGESPKSPPFDGYWVGDSWMMRLSRF